MFFSITATLSICLEVLVLFFYLQFALVNDEDFAHYMKEVVAFNWLNLAGLFFFGLSLICLAWIYLQSATLYIVTAIVAVSLLMGVVLIFRMSLKMERLRDLRWMEHLRTHFK